MAHIFFKIPPRRIYRCSGVVYDVAVLFALAMLICAYRYWWCLITFCVPALSKATEGIFRIILTMCPTLLFCWCGVILFVCPCPMHMWAGWTYSWPSGWGCAGRTSVFALLPWWSFFLEACAAMKRMFRGWVDGGAKGRMADGGM